MKLDRLTLTISKNKNYKSILIVIRIFRIWKIFNWYTRFFWFDGFETYSHVNISGLIWFLNLGRNKRAKQDFPSSDDLKKKKKSECYEHPVFGVMAATDLEEDIKVDDVFTECLAQIVDSVLYSLFLGEGVQ